MKRFFTIMKKTTALLIVFAVVLTGGFMPAKMAAASSDVAQYQPTSYESAELAKMELMSENNRLALYLDRSNLYFCVKDKVSGKLWFSNPPNLAEDTIAKGDYKAHLISQFNLEMDTDKAAKVKFDSYEDSFLKKLTSIEAIPNGYRVYYRFGEQRRVPQEFPQIVSEERLYEFFVPRFKDKIKDLATFKRFYSYPVDFVPGQQRYYSLGAFTQYQLEELNNLFDSIGYTKQDQIMDATIMGAKIITDYEKISLNVPVDYYLDGENFIAEIKINDIKSTALRPISNINFLEAFGASFMYNPGYIVVPDGSGVMMDFTIKNTAQDRYFTYIYGSDKGVYTSKIPIRKEPTTMPIFGINQGQNAMFGIVEDSDATAGIGAYKATLYNSYNAANVTFVVSQKDYVKSSNDALGLPFYQAKTYDKSLKVRYGFLNGEDATYSGMAKYYRDYLMKTTPIKKQEVKTDLPFYVDTVGGLIKSKSFFGISYTGLVPLTTFKQNMDLITRLKDSGVNNIAMGVLGWFNGGMYQSYPSVMNIEKLLGGTKDFTALNEFAKAQGVDLLPAAKFATSLRVQNDTYKKNNGFNIKKYATKSITQGQGRYYFYNPVTSNVYADWYNDIVSSRYYEMFVGRFIGNLKKVSADGILLSDLGTELLANYNEKDVIERNYTKQNVINTFKLAQSEMGKVGTYGANVYVLPYVDYVMEAPMEDSRFNASDTRIPFFQLVFHGLFTYGGNAMNFTNSKTNDFLRLIETGSCVYYKWAYAKSSAVKATELSDLYALNVEDWYDEAITLYKEANSVLGPLQDQYMIKHEKLQYNVYKVTYENGTSIIINYNDNAVTINNTTINAKDYAVITGGSAT